MEGCYLLNDIIFKVVFGSESSRTTLVHLNPSLDGCTC